MWMASILILYTLTVLTIAHVDRSRPTIKDDERFRNGLVCDLEMKLKTLLCSTCSKTISRTISYTNSPLNVSMNYVRKCDSIVNLIEEKRCTKNVLVINVIWPPSSKAASSFKANCTVISSLFQFIITRNREM